METKQITLRSQTVQCPHCGEYYSVTYKYCPFCDVGRQEAERRQAERKKQRQARLGGIFSSPEPEKKKKKSSGSRPEKSAPVREESRPERTRSESRRESAPVEVEKAPAPRKKEKESLFFSKPARKKTSELTEEEKKARLAEREARAAERKRERERLARQAAMASEEMEAEQKPASIPDVPLEPVAEAEVPEEAVSVEITQTAAPAAEEAAPAQQEAAPEAAAEIPAEAPLDEDAERSRWEFLRELEMAPEAAVVEVAGETIPEAVQPQPAAQAVEPPAQQAETVPSIHGDDDLDALLNEIRGMLAESPVPSLSADQMQKAAQPVQHTPEAVSAPAQEVSVQQAEAPAAPVAEPAAEEAPAILPEEAPVVPVDVEVEEPAPAEEAEPQPETEETAAVPEVEEPTIVMPAPEVAAQTAEAAEEAAAEADYVDDAPTQVIHLETGAEEMPAEETLTAVPAPAKEKKPVQKGKKAAKKKKSSKTPILLLLSLIIVIAAVVIVVKNLAPAFQTGLFSHNQTEEVLENAETVWLEQGELTFAAAGETAALVPGFTPEGASGTLIWTSDNEEVATVDGEGLVTAVGPGETIITATLGNGQSVQCAVHCTWGGGEAAPADAAQTGPGLSATDISLSGEGESRQLTLNGVEGAVQWSSDNSDVATVGEDGTVTAKGKGSAVISAEVDGQKYNCEVRCIW